MKNNYVVSANQNAWCPVNREMTYEERLRAFSLYVKGLYGKPVVLFLQEIMAGKGQKYLAVLREEFPEYELITNPAFDYHEHYRSIMNVTLIRKDALKGYSVDGAAGYLGDGAIGCSEGEVTDYSGGGATGCSMEALEIVLPNRIVHVTANLNGNIVELYNVHICQTVNFKNKPAWFIDQRKRAAKAQWDYLLKEAESKRDEAVIIGGDMQENIISGGHLCKLARLGYKSLKSRTATVSNEFFGREHSHIDTILFSKKADEKLNPVTVFVDKSKVGTLSDHAILIAACVG